MSTNNMADFVSYHGCQASLGLRHGEKSGEDDDLAIGRDKCVRLPRFHENRFPVVPISKSRSVDDSITDSLDTGKRCRGLVRFTGRNESILLLSQTDKSGIGLRGADAYLVVGD